MNNGNILTAVMYHYVRPIRDSAYPGIKGLELKQFEGQLDYLCRYHEIVAMDDVLDALEGKARLPTRAALLTFDDGYKDHYEYVRPILNRRGLSGVFFPLAGASLDLQPFAANMLHYVLSAATDVNELISRMEYWLQTLYADYAAENLPALRQKLMVGTRLDPPEVIYAKRMLQVALPAAMRQEIINVLFQEFVGLEPSEFARKLYCSADDLTTMHHEGHCIGNHGLRHPWLGSLSESEQRDDIVGGLRIQDALDASRRSFVFCYPYGDFNATTISILEQLGCSAAMTTVVGSASICPEKRFEIARLDTIDFPFAGDAPECRWSKEVRA